MSKTSKMVFAAFTQHCIQSNVTHVKGVEGVKYYVLYSVNIMSKNVCVCSFPIFDIFDIHSITALKCT